MLEVCSLLHPRRSPHWRTWAGIQVKKDGSGRNQLRIPSRANFLMDGYPPLENRGGSGDCDVVKPILEPSLGVKLVLWL
jgi:hypothetical protein